MVRALTIRFGVMSIGGGLLVVLADVLGVNPGLTSLLLFAYMAVGALIIGNYCLDHEDEIPTRAERRRNRRRRRGLL